MKKQIIISGLLYCFASANAQSKFEFVALGGYTFYDDIHFDNYLGRIEGDFRFGGAFVYNFTRRLGIDVMYSRMQAPARLYNISPLSGAPVYETSAGINHLMANLNISVPFKNSKVSMYMGPGMGICIYTPSPDDLSSNVAYAMNFHLGTNIYLSPRIGVHFEARLTINAGTSGYYYFGSWGDNLEYGSILGPGPVQMSISMGLSIGLGKLMQPFEKLAPRKRHKVRWKFKY